MNSSLAFTEAVLAIHPKFGEPSASEAISLFTEVHLKHSVINFQ